RCRSPTRPGQSETATSKTDFARSTAIVVLLPTDSSFQGACADDSDDSGTSDAFPVEGGVHLIIRAYALRSGGPPRGPSAVGRRSTHEPLGGRDHTGEFSWIWKDDHGCVLRSHICSRAPQNCAASRA